MRIGTYLERSGAESCHGMFCVNAKINRNGSDLVRSAVTFRSTDIVCGDWPQWPFKLIQLVNVNI